MKPSILIPRLVYIGIVSFYCLFLSGYGFELWDTGYIPSFSWRIANGEHPYEDFIYKGPPVTLYLHAFFIEILPEAGQFYFIRIINYLFFAFQVYFSVTAFDNFYGFKRYNVNKWTVMTVCFIVSLLNFPPYPWPTTDALLFASAAIYLLSLKPDKFTTLFFVALLGLLSALSKQSFYPVPFLLAAWVLINHGFKKAFWFCGFTALQFCVFLFWISSFTTIAKFVRLTTGETTLWQLLESGLLNYVLDYQNSAPFYIGVVLCIVAALKLRPDFETVSLASVCKALSVVLLVTSLIFCVFRDVLNASRVAFLSGCFGLLSVVIFKPGTLRHYSPVAVFLGISWCSAVSLGYPFPILYMTGIIVSLIALYKRELSVAIRNVFFMTAIAAITLISFSYTYYPYREKSLPELRHELGSVSPKLSGIKTSESNFEKLTELKNLRLKYGNRFLVAPNIPAAHYLFGTKSVLPADWIINTEINKDPKMFIDIASDKNNYVFLEKSFLEGEELMPEKRQNFSVITEYIYRNFAKVDETEHFIIYNGAAKHEAIPQID